jgi:hypothetical protein
MDVSRGIGRLSSPIAVGIGYPALASIRTAVVTLSPVILDIITTLLADRAALDILAQLTDRVDVEARLGTLNPDLVLFGLRSGETEDIARNLLALLPSTMIIALSNDGRDAVIHEMRPHRQTLRNISPRLLIRTILARSARPGI